MQAYLRDCEPTSATSSPGRGSATPAQRPPREGRLLGLRDHHRPAARLARPRLAEKPESDANYEKLTVFLLENIDIVTPNFASHNVRSVAHAIAQAERLGIDPRAYEFQALYGMADELKAALLQRATASASTAPSANCSPAWPTSSAACSRTPRTRVS
jgi:RHH-type proline utilization regulon transcriptional repressor/proline dehydrogenase/delta 1-pyrroline-5-carboxylate dehydrogenase